MHANYSGSPWFPENTNSQFRLCVFVSSLVKKIFAYILFTPSRKFREISGDIFFEYQSNVTLSILHKILVSFPSPLPCPPNKYFSKCITQVCIIACFEVKWYNFCVWTSSIQILISTQKELYENTIFQKRQWINSALCIPVLRSAGRVIGLILQIFHLESPR